MNAPFAPGVIERHTRPLATPAHIHELRRWLGLSALCIALSASVGMIAGLLWGAA